MVDKPRKDELMSGHEHKAISNARFSLALRVSMYGLSIAIQ